MKDKKSISELKEEIKLNRWKNAKYKVFRNAGIAGRLLQFLSPFLASIVVGYLISGLSMQNFAFPFEDGTEKKYEEYKNIKINNRGSDEFLSESSSSESGKDDSTITINEKPQLMDDGSYKITKKVYKIDDDVTEKQSKAIKSNAKKDTEFDYKRAFGGPVVLYKEVDEKPKIDKRYVTGDFIACFEVTKYVKHKYKDVAIGLSIGGAVLVWIVFMILSDTFDITDLKYKLRKSIENAKNKSNLENNTKDINKELRKRKKELRSVNGTSYNEVSYEKVRIYSIDDTRADRYEEYVKLGDLNGYDKEYFSNHGETIIKKENVYSTKDGSIISSSETDINTGQELKNQNGIMLVGREDIFETSDIDPQVPDEYTLEMIERYKKDKKVKREVKRAIEKGKRNINASVSEENIEEKAIELLGKSRSR